MITAPSTHSARQTVSDRITVALIARVAAELQHAHDRTGLSKTDIVNRAVSLYTFVDERIAGGDELLIRSKDTGQVEIIRLL
jgi:hypothetical protein